MNSWLIVVPARLKSERLPEKPVADVEGLPLIKRVFDNLSPLAEAGAKLLFAIDAPVTKSVCDQYLIPHILTDPDLPSGTDRVYAASQNDPAPFILNVQGDEPFIRVSDLKLLMQSFAKSQQPMGTLAYINSSKDDFLNPNIVKIAAINQEKALYFSRAPIPFDREAMRLNQPIQPFLHHIGVYAYRREALREFCSMKPSKLEQLEKLEQLRAIEAGWSLHLSLTNHHVRGIDTPEDLESARAYFRQRVRKS
jgi:3-deoxy-manno-octulosonate cytidylyltransferase (CMP-KDO synthetase)